jgi:hypothetical protein
MKKQLLASALFAAGLMTMSAAMAHDFDRDRDHDASPVTIAVFGDWPYNQNLLDNAPLLIDSVNADKKVSLVMHVGDIHGGKSACTSADILPPIASSNPGWNQQVYYQFQQFNKPFVYTPGDNEWTDCHKSKEKSSGDPLKELSALRTLFFAQAGRTLGMQEKSVWSQAQYFDSAYPADAKFVENTMWMDGKVLFVMVNVPGSNNDTVPWSGAFANPAAQDQEVAERTDANIRWLQTAFSTAKKHHARAVVIGQQADMWDPEAVADNELYAYTPYVQKLADMAVDFGRPVLLLNGDSHVYGADKPLADPTSATGLIHHTQAVPNLTRITVQGSTNAPAEWLRLTIDPRKPQMFSWQNVPYCKDPLTSCK